MFSSFAPTPALFDRWITLSSPVGSLIKTFHLEIQIRFVAHYHPLCNLRDLAPLPFHCDDPKVELPTFKNILISFLVLRKNKNYICKALKLFRPFVYYRLIFFRVLDKSGTHE
jgi:hypothetical protein